MATHWKEILGRSPALARVVPFVVFLGLTALQGTWGEASRYWIYLAKSVLGAAMVAAVWPVVRELRWTVSVEAIGVGILVFVVWIGADLVVPGLSELLVQLGLSKPSVPEPPWNPFRAFGEGSALGWCFVAVRILGSSLVVPPIEEMFYRSFLYRSVVNPAFENVPLNVWHLPAAAVTSVVFGLAHQEWFAGILCGAAYQWLALRRGHLGDAMTAHGVTNALLGIWVVFQGAWKFW